MNQLKALILTSSYPRHRGDYAGIFVAALAESLQKQKIGVTVLAPHGPGLVSHEPMSGINVRRYHYVWPVALERLAYQGGILPNLQKSWMARLTLLPYLIATILAVMRYGLRHNVIHAHWIHNGWLAGWGNIFLRKSLIVTVHGPDLNAFSKSILGRWIVRSTCRRADAIITVSESIRRKLIALQVEPNKVHHIPNGVPDEETLLAIPLKPQPYGHQLLYVGRLVPQKTVANLLTALVTVKKEVPGVVLSIVGEGALRSELEDLTKKLHLETAVKFIGAQPRDLIPKWFSQADVFVLPSRVEGFPIVILEAMAAGRAIVATSTEGVPEIIQSGHNGLMVPVDNPGALATAIISLLQNVGRRQKLGAAARATISKKYNWPTIATATARLYDQSFHS